MHSVGLLSVPYSTLAGASVTLLVRPALSALRDENLCIIRAKGSGALFTNSPICGAIEKATDRKASVEGCVAQRVQDPVSGYDDDPYELR